MLLEFCIGQACGARGPPNVLVIVGVGGDGWLARHHLLLGQRFLEGRPVEVAPEVAPGELPVERRAVAAVVLQHMDGLVPVGLGVDGAGRADVYRRLAGVPGHLVDRSYSYCVKQIVKQYGRLFVKHFVKHNYILVPHLIIMKSAIIGIRVDELTKAKIERIISETGLWNNPSDFTREALKRQIDAYWKEVPDDY